MIKKLSEDQDELTLVWSQEEEKVKQITNMISGLYAEEGEIHQFTNDLITNYAPEDLSMEKEPSDLRKQALMNASD